MPDQVEVDIPETTSGPPIVQGKPVEIAEGVFVVPDGRVPLVPNIGVIVGDRAVLVVDTGIGPRNGATVRKIATELAGDRPLLLTVTHFHPEHGFGAQVFADDTIVYNRTQRDELRDKGNMYLPMFRDLNEAVAREVEGVEFVDPHIVYDGSAELDLGGKVVRLRTWGAAHSRGDQVISLPEQDVLFAGDLVEDGFFPVLPYFPPNDVDVDGDRWISILKELEDLGPHTVVPGHGALGGTELISTYREYLELLKSETNRLAGEGNEAEAIITTLMPQLLGRYADWDPSEPWRIATGVQSFLAR